MAPKSDSRTSFRRVAVLTLIVFLSITVPVGIAWVSISDVLSGRSLGLPTNEFKIYQGPLVNGELLFPATTYSGDPPSNSNTRCRIKRLNLETGVERDTGIEISGEGVFPIRLNGELYGLSDTSIYKFTATRVEKFIRPARSPGFHPIPFLYDGRLTTIAEINDSGYRLLHLVDGRWVNGREILLAGHDRVWWDDPQRGRKVLLPLSSEQPKKTAMTRKPLIIGVLQYQQHFHILQTDYRNFSAYRTDFEFVDGREVGTVSALAPENAIREVSGWEPIRTSAADFGWTWMERDQYGILFSNHSLPLRVVRRLSTGDWEEIRELANESHSDETGNLNPVLLAGPEEATSYMLVEDQRWGAAVVHRIKDNTIQPAHLKLSGCRPEYLSRWQRLFAGLLIAWTTHLIVLIGGIEWCMRMTTTRAYEYGVQQAILASPARRAGALIVDGLLVFVLAISAASVQVCYFDLTGKTWFERPWEETRLCTDLLACEQAINSEIKTRKFVPTLKTVSTWGSALIRPNENRALLVLGIIEILFFLSLKPLIRARFGVSPGESLFCIRTVRVTLRPCGFARALLRDILYCVDIPFFVTPLPAAISMLLSPHGQRFGDRVADTLVVNVASPASVANKSNGPCKPSQH